MSSEEIKFEVLYTNQKTKKNKTWHDGYLRYNITSAKVTLYDESNSKLSSLFVKGKSVAVGEQLEFDRYLVTLENLLSQASIAPESKELPKISTSETALTDQVQAEKLYKPKYNRIKKGLLKSIKRDLPKNQNENKDTPALSTATNSSNDDATVITVKESEENKQDSSHTIQPKRRRVGLSRGQSVELSEKKMTDDPGIQKHYSLPEQLFKSKLKLSVIQRSETIRYPGKEECFKMSQNHSAVVRTKQAPTFFNTIVEYKNIFSGLLQEHIQVALNLQATYFRTIHWHYRQEKQKQNVEAYFRKRGIGFYAECSLAKAGYFGRNNFSDPDNSNSVTGLENFILNLSSKEHHSVYAKDDIWSISTTIEFEPHSTFLARNVFYGPSSSGNLEVKCLSSNDSSIASRLVKAKGTVYAIRNFNAGNEFTMLDNISNNLTVTSLISSIMNYKRDISQDQSTKEDTLLELPPDSFRPSMTYIEDQYSAQIDALIETVVAEYSLNGDQSIVLRKFAKDMIEPSEPVKTSPILLVHGAYGAGKSYLIGVLIVFLDRIMELTKLSAKCPFKILVASMTNIAVDNILLGLLKLGFSNFVRVGSIKKIAKSILPFTAQVKSDPTEDIKELQTLLKEENLTETEYKNINDTIKRFTKNENKGLLKRSMVVGTTCLASTFEIFENIPFPIIILDESSQVTEPMALVPVCRFACERLILVGDPLQLPPTLSTNSSKDSSKCGLDRPLFDRLIQMGAEPILLKTQYRCHPTISALSNRLFYQSKLINGVSESERQALAPGLPPLLFINVNGNEQQHARSKSYFNNNEVGVVVLIARGFLEIGIKPENIGVITLYKHQADQIDMKLKQSQNTNKSNSVQVSTVDAFQGAEKEITIVSCVRTRQIGFIDNRQRVNVALTRAKRHLVIVGCAKLLETNPLWKTIVSECRSNPNGFIHAAQVPSLLKSFGCSGEFSTPLTADMNQIEDPSTPLQAKTEISSVYSTHPKFEDSSHLNIKRVNEDAFSDDQLANKKVTHKPENNPVHAQDRDCHLASVNSLELLGKNESIEHINPKCTPFVDQNLSSQALQPPVLEEQDLLALFRNEADRNTVEDPLKESPYSFSTQYSTRDENLAHIESVPSPAEVETSNLNQKQNPLFAILRNLNQRGKIE